MKRFILVLAASLSVLFLDAQEKELREVLKLKMPLTVEDDMPGTRGASVAWHPLQKKYYAVFAGNIGYPLAVFDAKGTRLSKDTLIAGNDTRGLWYDPITKTINGNTYDDAGWFTYKLNAAGIPVQSKALLEGMNQPDAQSVGAYDHKNKQLLFVYDGKVHTYDKEGTPVSTVDINWGSSGAGGDLVSADLDDYNYTSLIYTGTPKSEVGFLNIADGYIELYDINTGYRTKTLRLPADAPIERSFNFAYANGIYWLFNMETRTWIGYK